MGLGSVFRRPVRDDRFESITGMIPDRPAVVAGLDPDQPILGIMFILVPGVSGQTDPRN